ncbi:hypothetical protein CDAR_185251 [Caerostris darwini]|uniref:Uncharacterized protein n=1 Tax=Caerostris darwini TaxID=1538125 RepID=A0AAV4SRS1_9ARAC|nr:hypothetical protein CDAR_185251 [Caerostris darwini]
MKEAYQKGSEGVANTLFIPPQQSASTSLPPPSNAIDKEAAASVVALALRPHHPLSPSRNHGNDTPDAKFCRHSGPSNERKPTCTHPRISSIPPTPPSRP